MNKIEEYKQEKDGLDILQDIPRYAAEGWEKITDGDKERLKWAGVFFRRQTPGRFMMRLRVPNGFMTAIQLRTIGEISGEFGKGFADITTRQQMQLRWFTINDVPAIWERLRVVDLFSLQTGMRQRVAVARGLAMDPKVLLMDEPFSALDALTRATLQEELARIWIETRKTVVMITNDIDEAILLADSIYTLTSGPGATLGPAVRVETPHPRSRSQLIDEPAYQRVRRDTVNVLMSGRKRGATDSAVEKNCFTERRNH